MTEFRTLRPNEVRSVARQGEVFILASRDTFTVCKFDGNATWPLSAETRELETALRNAKRVR